MKFPAAPLPSIIPWHIRKNRVSGEKKCFSWHCPHRYENTYQICSQYEKKLILRYKPPFHGKQLTLDSMLLYYHTEKSLGDNYLLQEPLGPSLGIQAQLPVLLAEYAFYEDRDITDYFTHSHHHTAHTFGAS